MWTYHMKKGGATPTSPGAAGNGGRTELFPGDAYSKVTIPGAVTGGCFGWFRTNSLADDRKSCWTVINYLSMAKLFASEALNSYQSEPNVAKRAQ
jgi:hypothetical protein